ncbi:MAG TPA: sugar O-acetyltransferase [Corynebacteriales bacterium]|nr:sugar O-acetyltransferase [Mycobacteriales bacterium]
MVAGEFYSPNDPELRQEHIRCHKLLERFNSSTIDEMDARVDILRELFAEVGDNPLVLPRLMCDYGSNVRVGDNFFANFDLVLLDCAPITIGDNVMFGPAVQLLTPMHPVDDVELRNSGVEWAEPITVEDNVWLAGGVIVCPGVTIGEGSVIGAGAVVTRDVPARVFAAGNPCRVIRELQPGDDPQRRSRP